MAAIAGMAEVAGMEVCALPRWRMLPVDRLPALSGGDCRAGVIIEGSYRTGECLVPLIGSTGDVCVRGAAYASARGG